MPGVDGRGVLEFDGRGAGERNGEPGMELTRRIRSDMGVDFVLGAIV